MATKGVKFTEEHKRKISEAHKGMKYSQEFCDKQREIHMGKKYHTVPHSNETKERISKTKKENPTRYWLGKKRPNMTGELNSQYIKDRTKLKKGEDKRHSAYQDWSKNVKKRDNWKCKMSNQDCCGRLESHHILNWVDYPELRYEINNGITLCHFHHPKTRKEEQRFSPYFTSLTFSQ